MSRHAERAGRPRKTADGQPGSLTALTPAQDVPDLPGDTEVLAFGSPHSGGMNMAFCDGSVHIVSYDIDWRVHRDMGDRADGNIVE